MVTECSRQSLSQFTLFPPNEEGSNLQVAGFLACCWHLMRILQNYARKYPLKSTHIRWGKSKRKYTKGRQHSEEWKSNSLSHTHTHNQTRIMLESTHLNVTPVSGGVRQKLITQSGDKWKQLNSKC